VFLADQLGHAIAHGGKIGLLAGYAAEAGNGHQNRVAAGQQFRHSVPNFTAASQPRQKNHRIANARFFHRDSAR